MKGKTMTWKTFCIYTTVGKRNRHDVIKTLLPEQLECLKRSVSEALSEQSPERQEMVVLIDAQLQSLLAHHG